MVWVMWHDGQPVTYAARILNDAKQRYPQTNKQLTVIVCGCEKFYNYYCDKDVDIQADHRSLMKSVKNVLLMASPKLQKLS